MLIVTVDDHHGKRRYGYGTGVVAIGSAQDNDLVLHDERVAEHHARLEVVGETGHVLVEDCGRTSGTRVGDRLVGDPEIVDAGDIIHVGPVRLTVRVEEMTPGPIDDETERRFLDALAAKPDDDETRAVYGDWLEQRGDAARAEFLRLQIQIRAFDSAEKQGFRRVAARLRALATSSPAVTVGWRARVAMSFIEAETCGARNPRSAFFGADNVKFELQCPQRWEQLVPTAVDGVRRCGSCNHDVHYCTSIDQARTHAEEGGCIAVDIGLPREKHDLMSPRMMMMGRPAPDIARRGRKPA
jgi:uncharacterized protein (TIGR02996 family)